MSNKIKILVVDDNPINRQYFSMALIKAGFKVSLAKNGYEAIEKAKKYIFDLILIDIRMPDMDGYEATTRIKQLKNHKNTPIIATSAEQISSDKRSLFNDFLLKPIRPKQLKQIVETYCKKNLFDVFNKRNALKFAYHDNDIMGKIITMFVDDLPRQFKELEKEIHNKEYGKCCALIHKIRGSCKACGADDLDSKLEKLSNTISKKHHEKIPILFLKVENSKDSYLKTVGKLENQ